MIRIIVSEKFLYVTAIPIHPHIQQFRRWLSQIIISLCRVACMYPHAPSQQQNSCLAPQTSVYSGAKSWCFSRAENRTQRSTREHLLNPMPDPASAPSFLLKNHTSSHLCEAPDSITTVLPFQPPPSTTTGNFGPPNSDRNLLPQKARWDPCTTAIPRDHIFNQDSSFPSLALFWSSSFLLTHATHASYAGCWCFIWLQGRKLVSHRWHWDCTQRLWKLSHLILWLSIACQPRLRPADKRQRGTTTLCLWMATHLPPRQPACGRATGKFTFQHLVATDHCMNVNCPVLRAASHWASTHKPHTRVINSYVL